MFENITKGVWSIDEDRVKINKHGSTVYPLRAEDGKLNQTNVVRCYEIQPDRSNAEFIAYCFNLQQRFDISKLEEAVELLEICSNSNVINHYHERIEHLLTKIKK